jgi:hypothetical protein
MSDATDNLIVHNAINSQDFQNRCHYRWLSACISVTTEVILATVNGTTAAGNATLHFAATPASIVGYSVADVTTPAAIGAGNTILSQTATTAVMAAVAITPGVGATDVIQLMPPSHTQRLALAGAVFAGTISGQRLAELVAVNTTIRTAILATPTAPAASVLDSDIDFQIASILTGVAISRGWI